jgi:hypothetical protein
VEDIKQLNELSSDIILDGQQILIPESGARPPTPTPTPEPWTPAVITGDLDAVYSLETIKGRFTIHTQPDTQAANTDERELIAQWVETALGHTRTVLQRRFLGHFDVYVATSLFEAPFTARQSFSLPEEGRFIWLFDDTESLPERMYSLTYAVTPLIAAQKLGAAATPLLREGLAVHTASQALLDGTAREGRFLTPSDFCVAFHQAGQLSRVSRGLDFEGHLAHLDQYFAAGCFVAFLMEEKGAATFDELYVSGEYLDLYGQSLDQLEAEWMASLTSMAEGISVDAMDLVRLTTAVNEAYTELWADFEGTPAQMNTYRQLGRVRLSLLQGQLDRVQEQLENLLGSP